jgi:hypothetical protein
LLTALLANPLAVCCVLGIIVIGILIAHGIWIDIQQHHLDAQLTATCEQEEPSTLHVTPIRSADHRDAEGGSDIGPPDTSVAPPGAIHRELTQLVRDDPDAAAEMLGQWVRKAS